MFGDSWLSSGSSESIRHHYRGNQRNLKETLVILAVYPLGEEKAVSYRLLVPTRIANLTRITDKMPTTKNSVVLVVDCITYK